MLELAFCIHTVSSHEAGQGGIKQDALGDYFLRMLQRSFHDAHLSSQLRSCSQLRLSARRDPSHGENLKISPSSPQGAENAESDPCTMTPAKKQQVQSTRDGEQKDRASHSLSQHLQSTWERSKSSHRNHLITLGHKDYIISLYTRGRRKKTQVKKVLCNTNTTEQDAE